MPIPIEDSRFPSEKSGLPVVKESPSIDSGIPFHSHSGTDGSPKIFLNNMTNKEELEGGKYADDATASSISISGAWATLTDLNLSKKVVSSKRFLLILSGTFMYSGIGGCEVEMRFDVDGTDTATLAAFVDNDGALNGDKTAFAIHYITASLSAATHTFRVEGRAVSGSGALTNPVFSVLELT